MRANTRALHDERDKFLNHFTASGRRPSRGREVIFGQVMAAHGHFTAEEMVKACLNLKVSRPTVYRALNELLEAGIIRETAFGDKHRHFEHVYDEKPHHHAQCVRCHRFIEFPDRREDEIYHPFLEKQGFKILGHEMHFYGICRDCRSNET